MEIKFYANGYLEPKYIVLIKNELYEINDCDGFFVLSGLVSSDKLLYFIDSEINTRSVEKIYKKYYK